MDDDEVFEDNRQKKNEWLEYVKNNVLPTAYSYARDSKSMENFIGFGIKNVLTLPS